MATAGCSYSASVRAIAAGARQTAWTRTSRPAAAPALAASSSSSSSSAGPSSSSLFHTSSAAAATRGNYVPELNLPRNVPAATPAQLKTRRRGEKKRNNHVSPSPTKPLTFPMVPQAHVQAGTEPPMTVPDQVRRYPQHPLLQFFFALPSKVPKTGQEPDAENPEMEEMLIPSPLSEGDLGTDLNGRSWLAPELRTKSSYELHQLWYVLLMEKNRLATSWEEAKRLQIRSLMDMARSNLASRNHRVRKSMARIKLVLNERRLALIQAQKQARAPLEEAAAGPEEELDPRLWEDEDPALSAPTTAAAGEAPPTAQGQAAAAPAEGSEAPPQTAGVRSSTSSASSGASA